MSPVVLRRQFLKTMWKDMITFPLVGHGMWHVWSRDFYYFRKYWVSSILMNFIEPLLYVVAFGYGLGFFVGNIDGIPYMLFLAPAILATSAMNGSVFECTYSSFTKLRVQKTYETIMMTPVSIEEIVAGEILWAATKSFISVLGVMAVFLVLGFIRTPLAWLTLPVLALTCYCFAAVSMVVTSFARDYDSFTYYFSLLITPMSLLAGTFFPLTHFPHWAQFAAQFLPLTHGVLVTRELFLGHWHAQLFGNVALLILISLLMSNWAINQMRRRLIY